MEYAQRQKRSHAKVRSGCTVCKARRIKCDENKPECVRCQISGRRCVYSVPKVWLFEPTKVVSTPTQQPVIKWGNHAERRAFQYFKEVTAPAFAGMHDLAQKFWNEFVIQGACTDPSAFKLVVAMGARHEAVQTGSHTSALLATNAHAIGLTAMARHLPHMRVDLSLLCSALLASYANLCEDVPATAVMHVSLALKIIREETIPRYSGVSDSMADFIVPMFSELELTSSMFIVPGCEVEMFCPHYERIPKIPKIFTSLDEAKRSLTDILRWQIYSNITLRNLPDELQVTSDKVKVLMHQWRLHLTAYGAAIANFDAPEFQKVGKMIFQSKLFIMCQGMAINNVFIQNCRVQVISVNMSNPKLTTILCKLRDIGADETWRPLAMKPTFDVDDLDIWPQGELVGRDGRNQIIRLTLGR